MTFLYALLACRKVYFIYKISYSSQKELHFLLNHKYSCSLFKFSYDIVVRYTSYDSGHNKGKIWLNLRK